MADALFGLTIALAAAAAALLARRPGWPAAALLGALLGLGGATKLSPLVVAGGIAIAGAAVFAATWIRRGRYPPEAARFAALGVGVALTAAVTFVAVYPYLWPDPVGRTRNLFTFRAEEMATQASDWPVMAVPTRLEALNRVRVNFAERFSLSSAAASLLTGHPAPAIVRYLELAIPVAGLGLMTAAAARAGPFAAPALVVVVLGGQALVTLLGMRSEFDRYHLPFLIPGAVAAAVALAALVRSGSVLMAWIRRAGPHPLPPFSGHRGTPVPVEGRAGVKVGKR
jgi:hypothetical protein